MQPLPRPSVSPLYSFCSIPTKRAPPLAETVGAVWRWATGRQPAPSQRELQIEQAVIDRLALELADEEAAASEE